MESDIKRYILLITASSIIVILDQLSKYIIQRVMRLHESIMVIDDFFSLTYIRNRGAAFGLLSDRGDGFRFIFFFITSVIALFILWYLFLRPYKSDLATQVSISLISGGAIGNLIDRIRLGEVVDFLDFYIGNYHWPAFNLADSAITVGIATFFLFNLIKRKEVLHNS